MYTENGNLSHGHGELKLDRFEPFSKNPPIAKVFREVSLADELGSGMRNTYKYTKMYSGGVPEFIEGDVFKTIIPLSSAATSMVGPDGNQDTPQDNLQDTLQDTLQEKVIQVVYEKIIEFCIEPKSKREIVEHFGLKDIREFTNRYIKPLLESGKLKMTIPDKPTSRYQKYVTKK